MDVREITFKSAILDKMRQNFLLDTFGKVGVGFVFAAVFEWQHCDIISAMKNLGRNIVTRRWKSRSSNDEY